MSTFGNGDGFQFAGSSFDLNLNDPPQDDPPPQPPPASGVPAAGGDPNNPAPPPQPGALPSAEELANQVRQANERLARLEEENRTLKAGIPANPQPPAPPSQQPYMPQQPNIDELKQRLSQQFMADPGGTLLQIYAAAAQQAQMAASAANIPYAQGQAEMMIDSFKQQRRTSGTMPQDVEQEFDTLVRQGLQQSNGAAGYTPQQIQQALGAFYEMAAGRVAIKRSGRQNTPPPYGTGAGANFGGGNRQQGNDMQPRDAVEREIVASGKTYGLSDEEIAESLRQHREG